MLANSLPAPVMQIAVHVAGQIQPVHLWGMPPSWTIATGTAGQALFLQTLASCLPNASWKEHAEDLLALTLHLMERDDADHPIPLGLFTGLTGVCLLVSCFARADVHYLPLQRYLDMCLFQRVFTASQPLSDPPWQEGVTFADYDVISGLTGIGAYALLREEMPEARAALSLVLERLVTFSLPHDRVPGHLRFFIPPERIPHQTFAHRYPEGATDLGFAHGLPGPLTLLSLAALHGISFPGLHEAITRLADWLIACRCASSPLACWPAALPRNRECLAKTRPVWCYGAAGVAWSLWVAGAALRRTAWQELALQAMQTVAQAIRDQTITSSMLCHGLAGVLTILRGFALGTAHPLVVALRADMEHRLYAHVRASTPMGLEATLEARSPQAAVALLEGAPGVALALISAAMNTPAADPLFPLFLLTDGRDLLHGNAP